MGYQVWLKTGTNAEKTSAGPGNRTKPCCLSLLMAGTDAGLIYRANTSYAYGECNNQVPEIHCILLRRDLRTTGSIPDLEKAVPRAQMVLAILVAVTCLPPIADYAADAANSHDNGQKDAACTKMCNITLSLLAFAFGAAVMLLHGSLTMCNGYVLVRL